MGNYTESWNAGGRGLKRDTTGAKYNQADGSGGSSDWSNKWKSGQNSWDAALKNAYGEVGAVGDGSGKYTSDWDSAVASAKQLSGKDYTDSLNQLAQDEIDKEKTDYGNELGAAGMRELSFRKDVQDDWAKRRTTASTQAAIDAQDMQTSALETWLSAIEGASGYELDNIAADLDRAQALVEAASAGASADQGYLDLYGKYGSK